MSLEGSRPPDSEKATLIPPEYLSSEKGKVQELQQFIKSVLKGRTASTQPETPQAPEISQRKETNRGFNQVIFGHSFRSFDRDQLITYYLALKVGAITQETPISFSATPDQTQLSDPQIMVIEPYLAAGDVNKNVNRGNYTTGTEDEPAAVAFRRHFSREIAQLANKQQLLQLVTWLEQMDSDKPAKTLNALNPDKLALLTPVFYGLKQPGVQPEGLLPQVVEVMDDLLNDQLSTDDVRLKYAAALEKFEAQRADNTRKLQERAKDPRSLRQSQTLTGLKLAYFDVRGLNVEAGGMTVAEQQTGADIILLIDDLLSDSEPPEKVGTQIIIRSGRNDAQLEAQLADRLQLSEALFGKGVKAGRFGGHPGVIASPPESGSGLDPDNLWIALLKHFNCARYTKAEFELKAKSLAEKLDTANILPFIGVLQVDRATLAEWQMIMTLSTPSGPKQIKLSESELGLYDQLLTENVEKNRQLLLRKTEVSEPDEVAQLRSQERSGQLEKMVNEGNILQVLLLLDDLNLPAVEKLSQSQKSKIVSLIASNDQAIKLLWDQEASVFQITQNIPDWIENNLDTYHAARYRYLSVPMKVHRMIESLTGRGTAPALVSDLFKIIFSKSYLESHQRAGSDDLFEMFAMAMVNSELGEEEAKGKLARLEQLYGADMNILWSQVSFQTYRMFKAQYPKLVNFGESEVQEKFRPNKFLILKPPTAETINPSTSVQTIFVEIGRSVRDTLTSRGIKLEPSNGLDEVASRVSDFAGEILATNRALRFDDTYQDHVVLAREIRKQVESVAELAPNSKIRIVMGSFPNMVTAEMIPIIPGRLWDRVFLCQFNQQTGVFADGKTLGQKRREAEAE